MEVRRGSGFTVRFTDILAHVCTLLSNSAQCDIVITVHRLRVDPSVSRDYVSARHLTAARLPTLKVPSFPHRTPHTARTSRRRLAAKPASAMDDLDMIDVADDIDIQVDSDVAAPVAQQPQQHVQVSSTQGCTRFSTVD